MKKLLVAILIAFGCINTSYAAVFTQDAQGYVTAIQNLDVNGSYFNVNFHRNITFNNLFGTSDPYFWGDSSGAYDAAMAIMTALERDTDGKKVGEVWGYNTWNASDHFIIPFQTDADRPATFNGWGDAYWPLHSDGLWNYTSNTSINKEYDFGPDLVFATFQSVSPVPAPSAIWLFGFGLIGLAKVLRKSKA